MNPSPILPKKGRIGFHYYPDSLHYSLRELQSWLPVLRSMDSSWITLVAPESRAIPEPFIRSLVDANIEPVLHFDLPLDILTRRNSLRILFESYKNWGVKYVALFDRPNQRAVWPGSAWAQPELVERFLDIYLSLAETLLSLDMIPVFPPLEPGGDYWDIAFLRAALRGIARRGKYALIEKLVLGAYAWPGNRPLTWGAGGPERWPGARPYFTPPGVQDQRGFFIFDWYMTISKAEIGRQLPVILLKAGSRPGDQQEAGRAPIDANSHAIRNMKIARAMSGDPEPSPPNGTNDKGLAQTTSPDSDLLCETVPAEVLCCNFWLLACEPDHPGASHAWVKSDGSQLPIVDIMRRWVARRHSTSKVLQESLARKNGNGNGNGNGRREEKPTALSPAEPRGHPIDHYLLLPVYDWGVHDWHLEIMRQFVKQHQPTVGFSIAEASLAKRVTILGGVQAFPEEILKVLRESGCQVERVTADGTLIAT
jgi:hypothetical protein